MNQKSHSTSQFKCYVEYENDSLSVYGSKRVYQAHFDVEAKVYDRAEKRKHRNTTPNYIFNYQKKEKSYPYTTWFFLQRLSIHDFKLNPYLCALRMAQGKGAIRSERRESLKALCAVMLTYVDMSPARPYLFEVRASIEELADKSHLTYMYWDNVKGKHRLRYDIALNTLKMLEEAELVTVVREYDRVGRQHKPSRIFLNVEFFLMLGVTEKELRKILLDFHKNQYVKNNLNQSFISYKKHLDRLEQKNVANLENHHALRNMLIKRRKDLLGERMIKFVAQLKPVDYKSFDIESDVFKPCFRSYADCTTLEEVHKLRKRLLAKEQIRLQAKLKSANDTTYREAMVQRLY